MTTLPSMTQPLTLPHWRHPGLAETTLLLVRHGRTASNAAGILHGVTDVPLDAHGLRQAERIAARLAELQADAPADRLLTSPLRRALTTARIIGERIELAPKILPDLREMDFGQLEGYTVERIEAEHPEVARGMWELDDDDFAWPGGESRRAFHARVADVFARILREHAGERVIVVCHGGVISSLIALIHGVSPNDWRRFPMTNCGLTHLRVTAEHTAVHLLNAEDHLADLVEEVVAFEEDAACDGSNGRGDGQ